MKKRNVAVLTAMLCAGMTAGLFTGVNAKADGVKLVFAQDLDTGEKANNVMNEILSEYTEKTGTEIQFESLPSADYRTWLMTQFAADQGPDVYTGIIYDMSSDYQSGYLSNFKDLYDQEALMIPEKHGKIPCRITSVRECISRQTMFPVIPPLPLLFVFSIIRPCWIR